MSTPEPMAGLPFFVQMQTLPPYWSAEAITNIHVMPLTAVIYAVLSSFLVAWQIWIWYLDQGPAGLQGPILQGFLAWLGYAAIARFAAFQFLGTTTSLASAAILGFAMDLSSLMFMFAHRMLACSYAAACQNHAQASHPDDLRDEGEKKTAMVPRSLAAIGHIFMSEQPAIPAAQGLLSFCLYMSHWLGNKSLLTSNTFQITSCLLQASISISAAAAFLAYGITHCQQRHSNSAAVAATKSEDDLDTLIFAEPDFRNDSHAEASTACCMQGSWGCVTAFLAGSQVGQQPDHFFTEASMGNDSLA
ncbi:hypothetical protein WJX74_004992 [Apatococcus lobatus]|uniref:Uncharacterized protein n=1 Tax=Apatococcus lobatus TaxID=904363 RepID=A0AAW1RVM5_9CHLO